MSGGDEPKVTLVREGELVTIKSRYGLERRVKINREWVVELDGVEIGRIFYGMLTRERRTPGLRYVNARWQSPGWSARTSGRSFSREHPSKRVAIESLIWAARRGEVS